MKAVSLLLLVALFMGSGWTRASAQDDKGGPSLLGSNAEGTRFMVGFMQNEITRTKYDCVGRQSPPYQALSIASRFSTRVEVRLPDGRTVYTQDLKPYQVWSVDIPYQLECIGEGVFKKGIEVVSTRPVSVYAFSGAPQTSDGYLALPVSSWGTQYVTSNFYLDFYARNPRQPDDFCRGDSTPRGGEFAVIASEDSTTVTVYPKTRTWLVAAGTPYTKLLMKGDIFQVQDGGLLRGRSDITGSAVTANKPVGLLSGHVRTAVPVHYESKDHLIEMIAPVNTLGKRYMTVPFGGREGGDLLRVISSEVGSTSVTITTASGSTTYQLAQLGDFIEYYIYEPVLVTSTRPVLVSQFARSNDTDPGSNFDPDMVMISPEEQFVNAAVFQTMPNLSNDPYFDNGGRYPNRSQQFEYHFVTVIARDLSSMKLDGKPITSLLGFKSGGMPASNFLWATVPVSDGELHVISSDSLFGGYVYGIGDVDSYCWPVGAGLRKFDRPPEKSTPKLSLRRICGGFEVYATDSGNVEVGLRDVWIDAPNSSNVKWLDKTLTIRGDEVFVGIVSPITPNVPVRVRLIAEDLDGNRGTLDTTLYTVAPTLSTSSIDLGQTSLNAQRSMPFSVINGSDQPMLIDSVKLQTRREFLLDAEYRNRTLAKGESLPITLLFKATTRKTFTDTVLVYSNCVVSRIPVSAFIPNVGIATHDYDFGAVRVGTTKCATIEVWNPGQADLRLDSGVISGPGFHTTFKLPQPVILKSGEKVPVVICFLPTATNKFSGVISFYGDADSIAIGRLVGRGIEPRLVIEGYDYGSWQVGDTGYFEVPVKNIGSSEAMVTRLDVEPGLENVFIVDQSVFPVRLFPDSSMVVPVRFAPLAEQSYLTRIFLANSDGQEVLDELKGRGYMLRAEIGGKDWGERRVGGTFDSIVHVTNIGNETITIDSVWLDAGDIGEFRAENLPAPVTLAPGASTPVPVQFSPLQAGARSAVIKARTSSRQTPTVQNVLLGFGLIPMASGDISFDPTAAYSCTSRDGKITIANTGNMALTIDNLWLESTPSILSLATPWSSGNTVKIPVGQSIDIDFTVDFAGYVGTTTGQISWTIAELPLDTFSHELSIESMPQSHEISAAAPASLAIGGAFDLFVRVDSVFWKGVLEQEVELRIEYNPTVVQFDPNRWNKYIVDSNTSTWMPFGAPSMPEKGVLLLTFRSRAAEGASLDSLRFLSIPFHAFLGNQRYDTFDVTMIPSTTCAAPSIAALPVSVDDICGLSTRLFEVTGPPYKLSQNSPNPVRRKTKIEFAIGLDAPTRLELFSADGRLVSTFVDAALSAGTYGVDVDASSLPSGLYYYRLTSGDYTETRPMQISK